MYYQEKWENNILYYKTTPKGKWRIKHHVSIADIFEGINTKQITISEGLNLANNIGFNAGLIHV